MTNGERDLWIQAKEDYEHAYRAATAVLPKGTPAETLQAASATILIHITKLRQDLPRSAAPVLVNNPSASAPVAVPPSCPECKGRVKPGDKRTEKSPDFVCLQDNGQCGKPSKDGKKWFPTGVWAKDVKSPALATATAIRDGLDSYGAMPAALQDDDSSGLPF